MYNIGCVVIDSNIGDVGCVGRFGVIVLDTKGVVKLAGIGNNGYVKLLVGSDMILEVSDLAREGKGSLYVSIGLNKRAKIHDDIDKIKRVGLV